MTAAGDAAAPDGHAVSETIAGGGSLNGTLRVPGDKSISHRALLMAAPAEAPSEKLCSWTPTPTMLPAEPSSIEGVWHSRWNGGATGLEWKQGSAEIRIIGANVFLLFRWGDETQKGSSRHDSTGARGWSAGT